VQNTKAHQNSVVSKNATKFQKTHFRENNNKTVFHKRHSKATKQKKNVVVFSELGGMTVNDEAPNKRNLVVNLAECPVSYIISNLFTKCPSQVEPETLAVIKWMQNYNFILSANLHGGAVVANYPFDKSRDPRSRGRTTYAATPDDKIFRKVCGRLKILSRCYTHLTSPPSVVCV